MHRLEGIVSKRADAPYRPGRRTAEMLKVKTWESRAFLVRGAEPVRGGTRLMLAHVGDDGLEDCGSVHIHRRFRPERAGQTAAIVRCIAWAPGEPLRQARVVELRPLS
jgi:hypothetical protein